jgi:hypothetical protein
MKNIIQSFNIILSIKGACPIGHVPFSMNKKIQQPFTGVGFFSLFA